LLYATAHPLIFFFLPKKAIQENTALRRGLSLFKGEVVSRELIDKDCA